MYLRLLAVAALLTLLAGCAPTAAPTPTRKDNPGGTARASPETAAVQQVVKGVFEWDHGLAARNENPWSSRAYRNNADLAPAFIAQIDSRMNAELGAAPILCAQNIPLQVTYDAAASRGDKATATAHTHWEQSPIQDLQVELERSDRWRVAAIICPHQ